MRDRRAPTGRAARRRHLRDRRRRRGSGEFRPRRAAAVGPGAVEEQRAAASIATWCTSGPAASASVELYLIDRANGKSPAFAASESFALRAGESQRAEFRLRGLAPGVHQGYLKLAGRGCAGLRRRALVHRRSTARLARADRGAAGCRRQARPIMRCFLPRRSRRTRFASKAKPRSSARSSRPMSWPTTARRAMPPCALLDPHAAAPSTSGRSCTPMRRPAAAWASFWVAMRRRSKSFNEPAAQELLPGKLVRQWRARRGLSGARQTCSIRCWPSSRRWPARSPGKRLPVFRHWQLGKLNEGAAVVLARIRTISRRWSNGRVGKGRVLTLTTPISDPASRRDAWNLLPTGERALAVRDAGQRNGATTWSAAARSG